MADLTPFFQQCASIVEHDLVHSVKDDFDLKIIRKSPFTIEDSFIKECLQFYQVLVELQNFLQEIRSPYLAINDETNEGADSLSREDKQKIDEEFNHKIQQLYGKLKYLQSYETKRQEVGKYTKKSNWLSWLGEDHESEEELWFITIGAHRTNILRFLNNTIISVNKQFDDMNKKRLKRDMTFALLDFRNLNDDDVYDQSFQLQDFDENQIVTDSVDDNQQLSQVQIQEYEAENQQLLNMKTNQLKQVERLKDSMVDIMNLQAELSFQLETQGDQINSLLDNQSQVEMDVKLGNKSLNKATKRNKKGADMLVTLCILFGFLILLVDYVSW
jgi:syntaxin 18